MDIFWYYYALCSLFTFFFLSQIGREQGNAMEYWDVSDWFLVMLVTLVFPLGWCVILMMFGYRLFHFGKQELSDDKHM